MTRQTNPSVVTAPAIARSPGPTVLGSGRAFAVLIGSTAAIVPLLYRTGWSDVFTAPKLSALWVVLAVCLALAGVVVLVRGPGTIAVAGSRAADLAFAGWLVTNIFAFAWSVDQHQSLFGERYWYRGLLTILLEGGFFLIARIAFARVQQLWWLVAAIAIGGTAVALVGVLQQLGTDVVFGMAPPHGRVFSTIGQPDSLAAYLVITIAITAAQLARPRLTVRVTAGLCMAVMFAALVLTESRGGYLGLVVAGVVAVAGLVWTHDARRARVGWSLLMVILIAIVLCASVPSLRNRLDAAWERTWEGPAATRDASNEAHLDLWYEGWLVAADHPLLGTGQDTFPEVIPRYANEVSTRSRLQLERRRVESPHNNYLAIAAGTGFPALAFYMALIALVISSVLREARRSRDRSTRMLLLMLVAALAGHLVTDAFMTADLVASWLQWILMGAGLAVAAHLAGLRPDAKQPTALVKEDAAPSTVR
jgi:putative inorganic carbon (hco3(-)) transporter